MERNIPPEKYLKQKNEGKKYISGKNEYYTCLHILCRVSQVQGNYYDIHPTLIKP